MLLVDERWEMGGKALLKEGKVGWCSAGGGAVGSSYRRLVKIYAERG
jgi:hypothetical protein